MRRFWACGRVAIECREKGTFRTLSSALLKEGELLPDQAADIISEDKVGRLSLTNNWPALEAVNASSLTRRM